MGSIYNIDIMCRKENTVDVAKEILAISSLDSFMVLEFIDKVKILCECKIKYLLKEYLFPINQITIKTSLCFPEDQHLKKFFLESYSEKYEFSQGLFLECRVIFSNKYTVFSFVSGKRNAWLWSKSESIHESLKKIATATDSAILLEMEDDPTLLNKKTTIVESAGDYDDAFYLEHLYQCYRFAEYFRTKEISYLGSGHFAILCDDEWCVVNEKKETIFKAKKLDYIGLFSEGFLSVCIRNKWGFINKKGDVVQEPSFCSRERFDDKAILKQGKNLIQVGKSGEIEFLLKAKEERIKLGLEPLNEYWIDDFSEGLAVIKKESVSKKQKRNAGFIDMQGRIKIPLEFYNASPFQEKLAKVAINKKGEILFGFINMSGKFAIEPKFSEASSFKNGIALAKQGKKGNWEYVFINRSGEILDKFRELPDQELFYLVENL